MTQSPEGKLLLSRMQHGLPPQPRYAARVLVGLDRLMAEWTGDLERYVTAGGSLLRIVVAPPGSGKTHLSEALKAVAAERGFLVSVIDVQANRTGGDDLAVYQTFCRGLTSASAFLSGDRDAVGLRSVIENVAERMTASDVQAALADLRLPVSGVREALTDLVGALREGASLSDRGWDELVTCLGGQKPRAGAVPTLRRAYPRQFRHFRRMATKRDAHLWMESLLLATRGLGFAGTLVVLDEHDDTDRRAIDQSIAQLRTKLDRLAQGGLPGTFVLYLVLEDFPQRVQKAHIALDQRLSALLPSVSTRMMVDLQTMRELSGAPFLVALAERVHLVAFERPMSAAAHRRVSLMAPKHVSLGGPRVREFVKAYLQQLDD